MNFYKTLSLLSGSTFKDALRHNRKPWVCDTCGTAQVGGGDPGMCLDQQCPSNEFADEPSFHRRRIFILGDWLDPELPVELLARMLDTIRQCDQVTWILCTKRPELWYDRVRLCFDIWGNAHPAFGWLNQWIIGNPPPHIILLASVENQEQADKRIPELLKIPAACRGLSLEPLLGAVDLLPWIGQIDAKECGLEDDPLAASLLQSAMYEGRASAPCIRSLDWLIIGGESGTGARPCNVEWIRSLVQQGNSAGVATFVKQLGSNWLTKIHEDERDFKIPVKHFKGGDPSEWPEDLRVREWPEL